MLDDLARNVLSEREFGPNEPLSIATAIAMDSCMGLLEEAKDVYAPILDYDLLYVHIRTLYRNIIGSIKTAERSKLTPYALAEVLATEMRVIETLVVEKTDGKSTTEFYHCTYTSIMRDFPKSLARTPTTNGQKSAYALEFATYKALKEDIMMKPPIEYLNRKFSDKGGKCLLLSHYPVDLLNRYKFRELKLLESHTGAIKPASVWNTKLKGGWDMQQLPFDKMTMQVFGDNIHFSPMDKKIRMKIFNIAVKNKWNHSTTKDYIIHCIVQNRDPMLEVFIKDLY